MGNDQREKKEPGFDTQIKRAEQRTEQAESRTVLAKTRTEQAESRTEQAKARIELAEIRTEQAESRTELAKTRTEQAESRTEQAETRSEQAVLASEFNYRRLFEAAREGILILEADTGRIVDVNPFLIEMLGFSHAELIGRPIWELGPFKDIVANKAKFAQLHQQGYVFLENLPLETKVGLKIAVEFVSNVYQAGDRNVIQCNVRDITGRRRLEEQFRQSQKMDAIGQLAGGVAHDFNNILAVIQIQADLLKTEGNLSPAQAGFAGEIGAATQRAAGLTRQLLMFSRKERLQLRDLDLNLSINNMAQMLQRILGEHIQMQFKFAAQPLGVHADAGMLDQVLMNLAVNSRDAMPAGGLLVIETSAVDFDESVRAQSSKARPGAFVCLSVSDTGCGIPPEILSRIFEPFFTTKDIGKGTGLGLATIFGIVEQHGGWINVYSEIGHGTTFRIYLPRLARSAGPAAALPVPPPIRGGQETILLVEDDVFLRASMHKILSQLGYRLFEAGNGLEALELWQQHRDTIQLLLTDLVMPGGMTGKVLGERLLKERPQLKVVYVSGYSAEIAGKDFPLEEGVNFLTKPFQAQKLAQVVRERLDARTA